MIFVVELWIDRSITPTLSLTGSARGGGKVIVVLVLLLGLGRRKVVVLPVVVRGVGRLHGGLACGVV